MSWVNRTIVITAANQALAQGLCAGIAGSGGSGMFTAALSPSGALPATHYVSSGPVASEFDAPLHDANVMYAAAQQAGAQVTLAQCQQLVSSSTVVDLAVEGPFATFARLGLQPIQTAA